MSTFVVGGPKEIKGYQSSSYSLSAIFCNLRIHCVSKIHKYPSQARKIRASIYLVILVGLIAAALKCSAKVIEFYPSHVH